MRRAPFIVQRFLDNPMLLSGSVIDIRAYVLLDPAGTVFLHKQLIARRNNLAFTRGESDSDLPAMIISEVRVGALVSIAKTCWCLR